MRRVTVVFQPKAIPMFLERRKRIMPSRGQIESIRGFQASIRFDIQSDSEVLIEAATGGRNLRPKKGSQTFQDESNLMLRIQSIPRLLNRWSATRGFLDRLSDTSRFLRCQASKMGHQPGEPLPLKDGILSILGQNLDFRLMFREIFFLLCLELLISECTSKLPKEIPDDGKKDR